MKKFSITGRILVSIFLNLSLIGCSEVGFAPTADAPIIFESGTALSDEFTQGYLSKKLDILFIVDNSGSMAEEQKRLGERIDSFLSTLYDVDWQIGITTTDVSTGKYGLQGALLPLEGASGYILTSKTPNALQIFKDTVIREETYNCSTSCPSGDEQALRAAIMAIEKRDTINSGFFRNGADLGLLVLSDEDEMSTAPANATRPAEVLSYMRSVWKDAKHLLTYGMIIPPGDTNCMKSQGTAGGHYGTLVAELATLTGGLVGSLCENDYAPTLGLLGENARQLLEFVQLRETPQADSIKVTFTPQHSSTFRVEGRRIFFKIPPPKGTNIRVDYLVD